MYKLKTLEIVLLAIFVIGSTSACQKSSEKCKVHDRKCFIEPHIKNTFKNIGGTAIKSKEYPCNKHKDTKGITIDIVTDIPLCVELCGPANNDDCNGLKFKNVTILSCGEILEIYIEKSKACLLDLITIYLDCGEIIVDKKNAESGLISGFLDSIFGADCNSKCKGKHCVDKNKKFKSKPDTSDSDTSESDDDKPDCKPPGLLGGILSGLL